MRSEAEIRKQIEDHLKRRGLWLVDAGLWALAVFSSLAFMRSHIVSTTINYLVPLFMLAWTGVLGLHTLRTVYVELRDYLVRRAIDRERHYYVMEDEYAPERGKRKHDDSAPRLTDDGELVDFPADFSDEEDSYAQRSRNS